VNASRYNRRMPDERWFTDTELNDMSTPTMDRAIAALDAGDTDTARRLCEEMKHEWRFLHDLMVEGIAGLISYVQHAIGEDAVADAWRYGNERGWKDNVDSIDALPRREIVKALAATWRAHSTSGVGPKPGAFSVTEDDEKFTFTMNPCGSGQRLVRRGKYEGDAAFGTTNEAHDWSYGRKDFPLYCTHCAFMNEIQPIDWIGYPIYPSDPPGDFHRDPCTWYWYKDPADIPARHFERWGKNRPGVR
jgi:hypothetical protein